MADLTALRRQAETHLRDGYAPTLLDLAPELRQDTQLWAYLWAPAAAIAAHRSGRRTAARDLLLEAIQGGFSQPEFFEGDLDECFESEADWPELLDRLRANVPPAPIELLSWPAPPPASAWPLDLTPGEHDVTVKVVTDYAECLAGKVSYRVR